MIQKDAKTRLVKFRSLQNIATSEPTESGHAKVWFFWSRELVRGSGLGLKNLPKHFLFL